MAHTHHFEVSPRELGTVALFCACGVRMPTALLRAAARGQTSPAPTFSSEARALAAAVPPCAVCDGLGVTDFEHDSAWALRLPLIGLTWDGLLVHYHTAHLLAWVDPDDLDGFNVPGPGYDPAKLPGAHKCKDKQCLKNDPTGHIIVPEGNYVPPTNPVLYRQVRGKMLEITIGPTPKED